MKATELIGKMAIRTKGVKHNGDMSFTDNIVEIIHADTHHIVIEANFFGKKVRHILNNWFCDNNWKDATDMYKQLNPELSEEEEFKKFIDNLPTYTD